MSDFLHRFKYKNITFLIFGLLITFCLFRAEPFHQILLGMGGWGYLGIFIAGILFTSTFTVATAIVLFLIFAEHFPLLGIVIVGSLGAMIGDLLIFRFVKNKGLIEEMKQVLILLRAHHLLKISNTRYFGWLLPVIGTILLILPLPDELGISLIGISRIKAYYFALLMYLFNIVGIVLVLSASVIIKP
ncbi:hypothetical protein HGB07_07170 [Candidatus Roizmanbacteria bacterium]|nr:hypothetical protein [Candidatus Roizmanbacteria bacterium]